MHIKYKVICLITLSLLLFLSFSTYQLINKNNYTYPIVDTDQTAFFDNSREIRAIKKTNAFYGQDANYRGTELNYKDNHDGTITDNITGLMWQKDPGSKIAYSEALKKVKDFKLAGYSDWRIPTIKELYSLIIFSGQDVDPRSSNSFNNKPFIDDDFFVFQYGNPDKGERIIDSQYMSSTKYASYTMNKEETVFGVNFADGRIKGYGMKDPRTGNEKTFYVMYVRGNPDYGKNNFKNNKDGTIVDNATGLMWMQTDSGDLEAGENKDGKLNWEQALKWSEDLEYAGYTDWRLPNTKELQSIVDYTRSPDTTNSPAIDPIFKCSFIINEGSVKDYGFYWTGTTHANPRGGQSAVYIAFGRALGWMKDRRTGQYKLFDVHGAGAQRSDPKTGDQGMYPHGHGPQGDVIRIYNYVRCVRDAK